MTEMLAVIIAALIITAAIAAINYFQPGNGRHTKTKRHQGFYEGDNSGPAHEYGTEGETS